MRHRPIIQVVAAATLVAVAACSGGDGDDQQAEVGSPSAEDTTTTTTTAGDEARGDGTGGEAAGGVGEAGGPQPPLVLVMDASGSMEATDAEGRTLLDGAKAALAEVVGALPDGTPTGLLVYGHRVPNTDRANGCRDTELIHPVEPLDREAMLAAIDGFQAQGFTPIGRALEEAAAALPPEGERSIVLVSDGEDTCTPPDPCEVAESLRADGVDLVINTVGFALGDDDTARGQLQCVAEAGGGEFHDVADAGQLAETLADVSVRDRRQAELSGSELPGAPLPRDAATGEPNTPYTDTVLANEENYYRFEVTPGSEVSAEVIVTGTSDQGGCRSYFNVWLTDAGADSYERDSLGAPDLGEAETVHTDPVEVDADEVFIELDTTSCDDDEDAEFDVELRLVES